MIIYFAPRPYEFHYELPLIKKTGGILITSSEWVEKRASDEGIEFIRGGTKDLKKFNDRCNKIILARHIRQLPEKPKKIQIFHGLIEKNYTYEKINFKSQYSPLFWPTYLMEKFGLKLSPLNNSSPFKFIGKKMRDRYDLICVPGPYAEKKLMENGVLKRNNWIKAGVPKLDGLKVDKMKRFILYAPTWGKLSSIPLAENIFKIARELGIEIIFKPHPLVIQYNQFGSYIKKFEHYDTIFVDPFEDATKYMPSSMALITDYSSVGIEYLLIDRPILFLHFKKSIGEAEKLLRKAGIVVGREADIGRAMNEIINGKDDKKDSRKALRDIFFYPFYGKATERVAKAIEEL